jgi:hypothetical protein
MKFRKKPIVVEAEQWLGPESMIQGVYQAVAFESVAPHLKRARPGQSLDAFYIDTLDFSQGACVEGFHKVSRGDWIITGVKGEKYPCKPDIFAATYEVCDIKMEVVKDWRAAAEKGEPECGATYPSPNEELVCKKPRGHTDAHWAKGRLTETSWPMSSETVSDDPLHHRPARAYHLFVRLARIFESTAATDHAIAEPGGTKALEVIEQALGDEARRTWAEAERDPDLRRRIVGKGTEEKPELAYLFDKTLEGHRKQMAHLLNDSKVPSTIYLAAAIEFLLALAHQPTEGGVVEVGGSSPEHEYIASPIVLATTRALAELKALREVEHLVHRMDRGFDVTDELRVALVKVASARLEAEDK